MKLINYTLISLIKFYKFFLSSFLASNCRYLPTCSEYSIEAFNKYGVIKGFYLSAKRILSCHPFGNHGYDPVPQKNKKGI